MAHIWQFVCVYWCRMSQKEETQKFVIWAKFQKGRIRWEILAGKHKNSLTVTSSEKVFKGSHFVLPNKNKEYGKNQTNSSKINWW